MLVESGDFLYPIIEKDQKITNKSQKLFFELTPISVFDGKMSEGLVIGIFVKPFEKFSKHPGGDKKTRRGGNNSSKLLIHPFENSSLQF